ncbi:MAG: hypothetical protein CMP76_17500 [Flavobacterium sp.]|uniref:hypothetical protein n=1 Tax=Flavobacterium sp. TaxID=239 RepID=UPI000C553239|nr:hypothetical protein [Flavobacterium sp.]MBF05076.1 hypothetical protein [Flavobacterium sp.]|tara:strand:+ start:720 stop:1184 length:465 start_codon:yes stop_codon:yes gene_type:complete
MKDFFKYEKGYINIDATYLYLTQTGNWSETDSLAEKSAKSKSIATRKKIKTYSFYVMLLAFSLLLYFNVTNGKSGKFMLPLGIILLLISSFNYFRAGSGSQYKIPLHKINTMEYSFKSLKIYFKNADNKDDFERIENVEPKGITLLKELKFLNS